MEKMTESEMKLCVSMTSQMMETVLISCLRKLCRNRTRY